MFKCAIPMFKCAISMFQCAISMFKCAIPMQIPLGANCTFAPSACNESNSECVQGKCVCANDFFDSNGLADAGSCLSELSLGQTCSLGIPDQCTDPNADCKVNGGIASCGCQLAFYRSPAGKCEEKIAIGASCASGVSNQCADENAECGDTNTCDCNAGFYILGSSCAAELELGDTCNNVDGECGTADSECKGNCACVTGFYDTNGAETGGTCAPRNSEPELKTYDCSLTLNQVFTIEMNDLESDASKQIAGDLRIILQSELGNVLLAVVLTLLSPGSIKIDYVVTLSKSVTPDTLQTAVVNGQAANLNNLNFITSIDPNSIAVTESEQVPCVQTSANRTDIPLNGRCGDHSATGICVTPNSACVDRLGVWRCRCESGFIQTKDQRNCTPAPTDLFAYHNLTVTLQVPKPVGTQLFSIPFSNDVANLCTTIPEVSFVKAFTDNNFRYEVNCTAVSVILDSSLSDTDTSFALSIQAKMTFSDLIISDEIVTIFETYSDVSIPTELCVTVTDGTFSGQLLATLPTLRSGESYDAPVSSKYALQGENVYCRDSINLTTITGQSDIAAFLDKFILTYGSKTLTIKFLIVRVEMDVTKREDTSTNSIILKYSISDSFTLISTDLPYTNLTLGVSNVRVGSGRLDFESNMSPIIFNIEVRVCSLTASTKVVLHITDVNDIAPQFSSSTYSFDIFPASLAGLLVGAVTATDIDSMTSLSFSVDSSYFGIDSKGVIKTLTRTEVIPFVEITGESKYLLNVTVSDGVRSGMAQVTVNLARLPGTNLGLTFVANIFENSPPGTYVLTANISDYSNFEFASDSAQEYFSLNITTGEVFTNKQLDRENEDENKLRFAITAFKSSETTCSLTVLGDLEVTVDDVNDNAPVFQHSEYTGQIAEGSTTGRTVELQVSIAATDADVDSSFTFGVSSSKFAIDGMTGVITTISEIDREEMETMTLVVTADDGVNTASVSIVITVIDVNDNPPAFTFTAGNWRSTSISEGISVGNVVTTVTTSDLDAGENGRIFYSIQGDSGYFRMDDRLSGVITVAHNLDREEKPVHTFTVLARDNGIPFLSVNTSITVSLIDINDNDPVFNFTTLETTKPEDACALIGAPLLTVSATDEDDGSNGEIASYSFTGGNEDGVFTIDTGGVIRCSKGLDYETTAEYKLVTVATDNGNPPRSSSSTVTITISDINDNIPSFTQELSSGSHFIKIRKSDFAGQAGKPVMVVTVVDRDSGLNGQIKTPIGLTLPTGLSLTLEESGVLRTNRSDPPIQNLTVIMTATDKGFPSLSSTATLTLEIVDDGTTEGKVQFQDQDISMNIEENTSNREIGSLASRVTYLPGATVLFDKVSGAENVKIDSSGIVKVEDPFDRETISSTVIVVRATVDDESDLALLTVTVDDLNDNHPTFGSVDKYRRILAEDFAMDNEVATAVATDQDDGSNQKITYTIITSGDCSDHFVVASTTGIISLDRNLDREGSFSFCAFSIKATDGGSPSLTATVPVEVTVTDVNDNSPLFSDLSSTGGYDITVMEDLRISDQTEPFGYITDADIGPNGAVDISLSPDALCPFSAKLEFTTVVISDVFKIILTLASILDYEAVKFHTCEVLVFDKGIPSLNNTVKVDITVADVNDNPPVFSVKNYNVDVSRDANIGHVITDEINATDAESTDLSFKFDEMDYIEYFNINFVTARITVNLKLVDLQRDDLVLNVIAEDGGLPPLSATATVSISIKDDNIRPVFEKPVEILELIEHASVVNPIFTAVATDRVGRQDPERCNCTYRFETPSETFEINNTTGEINVKQGVDIDREKTPEIILYIIATDPGNKDSLPVSLTLTIADINDQSPVFTDIRDGDYRFTLLQAAPVGSVVGTVIAEDADAEENAIPIYSLRGASYSWSPLIANPTDLFSAIPVGIYPQNGTIFTNGSLDLNATRNFYIELVVRAEDSKDSLKATETKVIIQVDYEDPNGYRPEFSQDKYRTSLAKSVTIGTVLDINVTASDRDTGADGAISYRITAGNIRDIFSIDSLTGQLSVAYVIDLTTNIVNMTIQAKDGGIIPKTGYCSVEIVLTGDPVDCRPSPDTSNQWFIPMLVLAGVLGVGIVALLVLTYHFVKLRHKYQDPNHMALRDTKRSIYTAHGQSMAEDYRSYAPLSATSRTFPGQMVPFHDQQISIYRSMDSLRADQSGQSNLLVDLSVESDLLVDLFVESNLLVDLSVESYLLVDLSVKSNLLLICLLSLTRMSSADGSFAGSEYSNYEHPHEQGSRIASSRQSTSYEVHNRQLQSGVNNRGSKRHGVIFSEPSNLSFRHPTFHEPEVDY
ncbi:protocadherin Fat 4-like [Ylistrum balloti]|uniref:protocadherin Fat 4-like n=1 Tax=Ylistrum balloti TaxID=509963 RepID=UPI0029058A8A|nr:protocadherin Fat 4-like [Ylistrum balloti]